MFTETPPSGRRVRGKPAAPRQSMGPPLPPQQPQQPTSTTTTNPTSRQPSQQPLPHPRKSSADHPATPLASVGPPNFSYGSATLALPRKISLADTKVGIFGALNKAAKDAHERDVRAGKVAPEPEGQIPIVRFYEESLEEIPSGPVSPPKIRALKDDPPRRNSPRRSTRNAGKTLDRGDSPGSSIRRTPSPTPSEGALFPDEIRGLTVESADEKPITHVLVRESASPAKRASPAKTRKPAPKKETKGEATLDSSNYEFSKDYSEEERAYQELKGRSGAHRFSIKETHFEEDEEDEDEDEDEEDDEEKDEEYDDEEEEDEEEGEDYDDEEYENEVLDDESAFIEHDEEPEDFILQPRQSIFTPVKNAIFFTYFLIHNLVSSTYHGIISFTSRLVEIFIYTPILWTVDSFKSLFQLLHHGLNNVLAFLGATTANPIIKTLFATILTLSLLLLATPPTITFLDQYNLLPSLSNFRFPIPKGTYIPPDLPPSTAAEIIDRLTELERHLSSYSSLSNQVLEQNAHLQRDSQDEKIRRAAIDDSIYLLKQDLEKLSVHAKSSAAQLSDLKLFHKDSKDSIKDLHNTILKLDAEVGKHETEMKRGVAKSDAVMGEMKALKSNIEALKKGLTHVEGELKRVSDYEYISKIALKSISEYLPSQLAVKVNPKTRRIEINPEFWTALRGVFADREEMEQSVASQASKIAGAKVVNKEISWAEFLRGNEEAIKSFVKVQMDDRWNKAGEDGVIVSRDYFLEILHDQVSELRSDLDSKMVKLLDKFDKQSKDTVQKAIASADALLKRAKKASSGAVKGGDLSTEAMNSIVETALHRYSTDTLAKPDYALYSSGARINPLLTSPTYHHSPSSLFKKLGSYVLGGAGSTWGHQPAMALFQDTNVGMCWAFPGSQGGLGIRLSETVLVTDVSVEHVHREVSKNIGSAPRQWSLYAFIADENARDQISTINAGLYDAVVPANLPRGYTLLVRGEYDVNNEEGRTIQTVPVPAAIRRLNVPVEQVVFTVASNWGNQDYTCLYRVRVHGQGLHDEDAEKGFGDDEVV